MRDELEPDDLAAFSEMLGPVCHVGVLTQHGATLALGEATPHSEFDLVV